jgi:hypothetical protein
MHAHMPGIGTAHGLHFPFRHHPLRIVCAVCFGLVWAGAVSCMLVAVNRGASALKLEARLKALKHVPEAFTEEERLLIVHKVTSAALRGI